MARKYLQGIFKCRNPQKYAGDASNIVYRSSWEMKVMKWLDDTPSVLTWNSEEVVIPYISPVDGKYHRYYIDFVFVLKDRYGTISKHLVEVKPYVQTLPPKNTKSKRYAENATTYIVNVAKWEAAKAYAESNQMKFRVLTEKDIFN